MAPTDAPRGSQAAPPPPDNPGEKPDDVVPMIKTIVADVDKDSTESCSGKSDSNDSDWDSSDEDDLDSESAINDSHWSSALAG